jgi:prolyl 4-hydroxylase
MKTLATEPSLFVVEGVLTEDHCARLVDDATRAGIRDEASFSTFGGRQQRDEFRTSTSAFLTGTDTTIEVSALLASLTRVPIEAAETLQVVHYSPGQHYHHHHDSDNHPGLNDQHSLRSDWASRRVLTGLVYLNDVSARRGGGTNFPFAQMDDARDAHAASVLRTGQFGRNPDGTPQPLLQALGPLDVQPPAGSCDRGVTVQPRRGTVVLFYNLRPRDNMHGWLDPFAMHSGCDLLPEPEAPVDVKAASAGSAPGDQDSDEGKWAANFWQWNHVREGVGGYTPTLSAVFDDGAEKPDAFLAQHGLRTAAEPEKRQEEIDDGEDDDNYYPEDDFGSDFVTPDEI